jgi:glycerol uptake facilitator protein
MSPFIAEILGTAVLILLGDGVVANVALSKTKGNDAGLIVVAMGWAMAVFAGAFCVAKYSGAHLNPAVTIGLAAAGKFAWSQVAGYIVAQMLGAMLGAFLVWLCYKRHFDSTADPDAKLGVFCTSPAIRSSGYNLITEIIATAVLILGILYIAKGDVGLGALDVLPVAFLVLGIGVSLGGPTGYAINPARDLGPRIMHFLLPIPGKRDSDWRYAWIPVVGPILGAILAALIYLGLQ